MPTGVPERKCGAIKKDGNPCGLAAGHGTDHPGWGKCRWHFGSTPSVKHAAEKEKVTYMAERACKSLNLDVDYQHITPEMALLEEVRRSYGIVAWFDSKLGGKTEDDLTKALIDDDGRIEGITVQAWFQLYNREREHAAKVYKMAIDAGVAVRQLALLESQAADLARAIRAVLDGLQLTDAQAARAPQLLRAALTAIPVTSTSSG